MTWQFKKNVYYTNMMNVYRRRQWIDKDTSPPQTISESLARWQKGRVVLDSQYHIEWSESLVTPALITLTLLIDVTRLSDHTVSFLKPQWNTQCTFIRLVAATFGCIYLLVNIHNIRGR